MKKTHRSHHSTMTELNITPLLDLVFVLLVIFIITTPQLVNDLEMVLPSSKPPPPLNNANKPKINRIAVKDDGQIVLNDQPLTLPEFRATLTQMKGADKDLAVVVNGADEVAYQHMVNIFDVLRQLDITKVGLATTVSAVPP